LLIVFFLKKRKKEDRGKKQTQILVNFDHLILPLKTKKLQKNFIFKIEEYWIF